MTPGGLSMMRHEGGMMHDGISQSTGCRTTHPRPATSTTCTTSRSTRCKFRGGSMTMFNRITKLRRMISQIDIRRT
eukprot:6239974-Prymnesium_polylepis.2